MLLNYQYTLVDYQLNKYLLIQHTHTLHILTTQYVENTYHTKVHKLTQ